MRKGERDGREFGSQLKAFLLSGMAGSRFSNDVIRTGYFFFLVFSSVIKPLLGRLSCALNLILSDGQSQFSQEF